LPVFIILRCIKETICIAMTPVINNSIKYGGMNNMHVEDVLRRHARNADRLMVGILWAMLFVALALSGMHDTLGWALAVGIPAASIPGLLALAHGGTRATRTWPRWSRSSISTGATARRASGPAGCLRREARDGLPPG
jgi:hypothetical protein